MRFVVPTICALALAACDPATPPVQSDAPEILIDLGEIETDQNGRCFARDAAPTEVRIVEETIVVVPEKRDNLGRITQPAVVRSQDGPQTFRIGNGTRFETLCPQEYTPAFVGSLQRAMQARDAYAGPITNAYDDATSQAVRAFQRSSGIDSPLLRRRTALELGLTAAPRG